MTSERNTIADQIGGKAFFMMGACDLVGDETSLLFRIKGCRVINKIRVSVNGQDLYRVEFFKITKRGMECRTVKDVDGVQVGQLRETIENTTGLYLSL